MHKQYIEEQYRLAQLDFEIARNEEEQWDARRRMSRLMRLAAELYGFAYADALPALSSHKSRPRAGRDAVGQGLTERPQP